MLYMYLQHIKKIAVDSMENKIKLSFLLWQLQAGPTKI